MTKQTLGIERFKRLTLWERTYLMTLLHADFKSIRHLSLNIGMLPFVPLDKIMWVLRKNNADTPVLNSVAKKLGAYNYHRKLRKKRKPLPPKPQD